MPRLRLLFACLLILLISAPVFSQPQWTPHTVAFVDGIRAMRAVDADNDGDIDIATASHYQGRLMWVEQNGSPPAPLVVTMTPHYTPITIPAGGGTIICDLDMDNPSDQSYNGVYRTVLDC